VFDQDETMHYDLPDLRLVAAIADTGSLTRGASRIHLAPSSASHRLTQFEAALGTPLFFRHARGLSTVFYQKILVTFCANTPVFASALRNNPARRSFSR
jgi:hypothetical protein